MIDFPQKFTDEIRELLGDEYDDFIKSYEKPMNYGLRINTLKTTPEAYLALTGEELRRVDWNELGFYYDGSQKYTKNPLYHAGLYYVQEPSAMRPAHLLPIEAGDKVLDMCAAPGGKSTALGAKLAGTGLLVSNDVSASRAKALLKNIEFFGIKNSLVLSEYPKKLAEVFPEYFDKVLIDAPCSGEGMFRKKPSMTANWEKFGPEYFGAIQREILQHGADMLKPGGLMVYSTCTFSGFEDEGSVNDLLEHRPEMEVLAMERLWPHQVDGEGHFCALLKKAGGEPTQESAASQDRVTTSGSWQRNLGVPASAGINGRTPGYHFTEPKGLEAFDEFLVSAKIDYPFDRRRLVIQRESLYYFPENMPEIKGLHVIRNGWYLGELKKKRFEPSGAFARALDISQCGHVLDLKLSDGRVIKYLKCETIETDEAMADEHGLENGWYLVCVENFPLGFGKMTNGTLKNKYPVGWRW